MSCVPLRARLQSLLRPNQQIRHCYRQKTRCTACWYESHGQCRLIPSIADHFRLQATISLHRLYDTTIMLPTYSKQYDAEDATVDTASDPLLGQFEGRSSTETAPPVYPPSSSSAPPPSTEGRHNVVYKYKPVFPRVGDEQYAVGVLGRSRAVSYIPCS